MNPISINTDEMKKSDEEIFVHVNEAHQVLSSVKRSTVEAGILRQTMDLKPQATKSCSHHTLAFVSRVD